MSFIRSILRPFYKAATVPPNFNNRMRWRMRALAAPFTSLPLRVTHRDGETYELADDFIDDEILREAYGRFYRLFFPEIVASSFPPNGLILDVGAHHGTYTVMALRRYPGVRLIAVEPDPKGAKMLRNNLKLNNLTDRAEIVEAAIADTDGTSAFVEDSMGSWGNHLVRDDDASAQTSGAVKVKTVRLATVLQGRKPDLVKINAEGAEFSLIPQMFAMNILPKWIILLAHPEAGSEESLLKTMREQGYDVQPVESDPGRPRYLCVLK